MPTYQLLIDDKVVGLLEALKSRADTLHQATAISAQEPIGRSQEKAFGEINDVDRREADKGSTPGNWNSCDAPPSKPKPCPLNPNSIDSRI